MSVEIKVSSKGQIVIPKDVREALQLFPGSTLRLSHYGHQIILEAPGHDRPRISYEEFRRRVPKYEGPPATIEDMRAAVDRMFAERKRQ